MKILVIDNNINPDSWGARTLVRYARVIPGAEIIVRRAPHDDLPKDIRMFDKIVMSGSLTSVVDEAPWIDHLDELVRNALDRSTHMLGVCYGHQTLARILGGREITGRSPTNEHGWTKIQRTLGNDTLMNGLAKEFWSFSSHYDQVHSLPPGSIQLASSDRCAIQAFQLKDRPVFGIQFHPEKNLEEGKTDIDRWRKDKKPQNLLHPDKSESLYDAEVGEKIFGNFFGIPR